MNRYIIGQEVRLKATFTNEKKELKDPTKVIFKVKDGNGKQTTYTEPTREKEGVYFQLITITNAPGPWWYRAEGEGLLVAANEATFVVSPTHF